MTTTTRPTATTAPTIRTFNTGRTYTPKGQRIAYAEISRDDDPHLPIATVVFYDVDRHIDGLLQVVAYPNEPVTQHALLQAYDHGGYVYSADRALLARLKAAAEAL
jgi:hypothetical protein